MTRWLAALAIILSTSSNWAVADTQQTELDALIKQATGLSAAGKYEEAISVSRRALDLAERDLGPSPSNLSPILTDLAGYYLAQRNYTEAEASLKRALAINVSTYGADNPENAAIVYRLGELYRQLERFAEAEPLLKQALALKEKLLSPDHVELVSYLNSLGLLYWSAGRYAEAEEHYKRGLAIAEKTQVSDGLLESLNNNLAILTNGLGRYKDAETYYKSALAIAEKAFGPSHAEVGRILTNLSLSYWSQGLYQEAEPLLRRALTIRETALGPDHPDVAHTLNSLALVYAYEGKYADAEPLYKRAIAVDEKAFGPQHTNLVSRLSNLADLYRRQELFAESEPLYKRALDIAENKLGPRHPLYAAVSNNLGWVYWAQGRYSEAEPLYERALATAEQVSGSDHPNLIVYLHNLAALYRVQGRLGDAEKLLVRAVALGERVAPQHPNFGKALDNLALVHAAQGRYADAEALFKRAIAVSDAAYGPAHADGAAYANDLGSLYVMKGEWAEAVESLGRGSNILIERSRRTLESLDRARTVAVPSDATRAADKLRLLISASFRLAGQAEGNRGDLTRQTFETAQWTRGSEAAASIAQMAARGAKGDPALSRLVRERQDLAGEWQARDKLLTASFSKPAAQRLPSAENTLREQITSIGSRLEAIQAVFKKSYPDFAALESAEPLAVEDVQASLRPDEALVLLLDMPESKATPGETFIWAVTKTDMRWVRSELGTPALAREVAALRCGLDDTAWVGPRCAELTGRSYTEAEGKAGKLLPFDQARANRLYQALFGQVEDLIKSKSLIIVPSGPLTQLPFQVLITKPPASGDYKSAAWLARHHALTVLPAVSSLKALRRVGRPSAAAKPMIGFGNPLLDGDPKNSEDKQRAQRARDFKTCPSVAPQRVASKRGSHAGVAPLKVRGGLADIANLRFQVPLPETADELCAVASSLGADPGDIRLGSRATEREVKRLSGTGQLAQYRIVHFATHGALAGQVLGSGEPGLLLTPPAEAGEEDDGYLTASEIAALKLDADWVILSACNTAAGGAEGAEALLGLARAFIYAQARALLVSHWEVNSDAAVKLITGAAGEIARHRRAGRAEALRRAMLALIEGGKPDEAHPAYWAPFVLVGEGAAAR